MWWVSGCCSNPGLYDCPLPQSWHQEHDTRCNQTHREGPGFSHLLCHSEDASLPSAQSGNQEEADVVRELGILAVCMYVSVYMCVSVSSGHAHTGICVQCARVYVCICAHTYVFVYMCVLCTPVCVHVPSRLCSAGSVSD